jgi:hypothetical protein
MNNQPPATATFDLMDMVYPTIRLMRHFQKKEVEPENWAIGVASTSQPSRERHRQMATHASE